MKKRFACLLFLFLFMVSNTAFATNWVYIARGYENDCNIYIDTDTVVKNGELIKYWELIVLDREEDIEFIDGVKKIMVQYEAKWTSPRKYRDLQVYYFDARDNELWYDDWTWDKDARFFSVDPGCIMDREIDAALRYAR